MYSNGTLVLLLKVLRNPVVALDYFIVSLFVFFLVFSAGNKNKEDLCWRTVCQHHHRRCETVFRSVWKGELKGRILHQCVISFIISFSFHYHTKKVWCRNNFHSEIASKFHKQFEVEKLYFLIKRAPVIFLLCTTLKNLFQASLWS